MEIVWLGEGRIRPGIFKVTPVKYI